MPNQRFIIRLAGMAALLISAASGADWVTRGFADFRMGTFSSGGANLYVSAKGRVQTVHRFDLNGDGYFDLIFADSHDWNYTVPAFAYSFRKGDRAQPARRELPGAGSVRVLAADLNEDGYPDLVVARGFDNVTRVMNSSVYWGGPEGWSDRFHSELFTPYVRDACAGDLDHDGHPDLVFLCSSTVGMNRSYVYWGGADGYSDRRHLEFETPGATSCLSGDLDRDGYADLVVTATGGNGRIFWGGAASFGDNPSAPLPAESSTAAAISGDRLLLSGPKGVSTCSISNRTLRIEQQLSLEDAGRMAVGDVNGDRLPDLLVTHTQPSRKWMGSSRIFWGILRNGSAGFSETSATDLPTMGAADAAIADIDGDGCPDVVFANSQSDRAYDINSYIYWGGASGLDPSRRTEVPTHGALATAVAGGTVIFANSTSGRPKGDVDSLAYLGGPHGNYSVDRMLRFPTVGAYEASIADLDDDGRNDLLITNSHEGTELPAESDRDGFGSDIFWGGEHGPSGRRTEVTTLGAIGCAVADLNEDGYLDLVFGNYIKRGIQIFHGGPKGFEKATDNTWPLGQPMFPSVADLDRDGNLDLIVPSATEGLWIFRGAQSGFDPKRSMLLDGIGPVSAQVADLNQDGFLDIIVFDLKNFAAPRYQGINSKIYWGSPNGYSSFRRSELPSSGSHYGVVADFNRDGHLDIFVSNYQSEFTRSLDSFVYWGNPEAHYTTARRLALHNESAAGAFAADLDGDGWKDLAVANHVAGGVHRCESLIFWNRSGGLSASRTTSLPTIGAHMMLGVDLGNIYTRELDEVYTSKAYDAGAPVAAATLSWAGEVPFGSRLAFEVRSGESEAALRQASWVPLANVQEKNTALPVPTGKPRRWWQYRVHFLGGRGGAAWPVLTEVSLKFSDKS